MRKKLKWVDIADIIDENIHDEKPTCFVCDEDIAGSIMMYLEDAYNITAKHMCEITKGEYYVTIFPNRYYFGEAFCEGARNKYGDYKCNDIDFAEYYIFSNMSKHDAFKNLIGGNIEFCEYECDFSPCKSNCDVAPEDDSCKEEVRIIAECIDFVFDNEDVCVDCKIEKIINTIFRFKDIGFTNTKDMFRCFVDNLDDMR